MSAVTTADLTILSENPLAVLTDDQAYSEFYEKVKAECDAFVPNLETATGRNEVAAMAFRVTRTKTALDKAGKDLNAAAREKINAVDAQRRKVRAELDALADEVRRPLTEWEDAERERKDAIAAALLGYGAAAVIHPRDTSETVDARLNAILSTPVKENVFQEQTEIAIAERSRAIAALEDGLVRLVKAEADAAELAKLRQHQREEAERLRRSEREKAEAEAKQRADAAIAKAEAEKQAVIAKAKRQEQERKDALARQKAEDEARAADREHRGAWMGEAKDAIAALGGISQANARKIVLAIVADEIPHVTLKF